MMENKIKIAFLGNPEISVKALQAIYDAKAFEIVLVITNVDKKIGRDFKEEDSEVAKFAKMKKLNILKTLNINSEYEYLKDNFEFDYLITCAFGQFLSEKILSLPKKESLNIHASLLPVGRGGAPIHWAIIKGEKETGYSLMKMIKEMDAGEYYIQHKLKIDEDEIYDSLKEKLGELINENIVSDLKSFDQNKLKVIKQDETKVTFWKNIQPEDEKINFNDEAMDIFNKIRGLNSTPGAYGIINNLKIKFYDLTLKESSGTYKNNKVGEILNLTKEGIFIKINDGIILVKEITIPGKKRNKLSVLINGKLPFKIGDIFS